MFDPLHKWLGIPPDQQPPNHYRLLGIDRFESDPDVIDAAADKQLTFLHEMTGDEHAEAAETISNQVSIARLCLLDPKKKASYDSSLTRSDATAESSAVAPVPIVAQPSVPNIPSPRRRSSPRRSGRHRTRSPWGMVSAIGGIVILLLLVLAIQQGKLRLDWSRLSPGQSSNDLSTQAERVARAPSPTTTASGSSPTEQLPDITQPYPDQQVITTPPISDPPSNQSQLDAAMTPQSGQSAAANPAPSETSEPPPRPEPRRTLADLLHNTDPDAVPSGDPPQESSPQKSPHPSQSELADKLALVRELYQDQYRSAKSSDQRIELARQMHRDGELTSDDPVGRFALWQVARDIFAVQGRFNAAMAIADNLATFYQDVDAETLKLETLKESSAKVAPDQIDDFFDATMLFANHCIEKSRHQVATDAIVFMLQTFADRLDFERLKSAKLVRDQAVIDGERYQEFKQAIERLAVQPDANANETVGKYLALVRGDWQEAAYYLAESSNQSLALAGMKEIEFQNSEASTANVTAIDVADAWYAASGSIQDADQQARLLRHSLEFYQTATESAEGLAKRKAELQIAKINDAIADRWKGDPDPSATSGGGSIAGAVLGYRVYHSSGSKSDYAKHRKNQLTIGMGNRVDGIGEAAVGVELKSVEIIQITGSASHDEILDVDAYSKAGFVIDYHTPGGYTKRVFLGLGLTPGREFTDAPEWGTGGKPEFITDIGKLAEYNIDLTRWAPPTWDKRCWVTLYLQNAGQGRSIEAELK